VSLYSYTTLRGGFSFKEFYMKRLLLVPVLAPLGTMLYFMLFENRSITQIYTDDWFWGIFFGTFWLTLALYTPNILKMLKLVGSVLWDLTYTKYSSWNAMRGIVKAKKLRDLGIYSQEEFDNKVSELKFKL
jgi:hypothetical protein